MKAVGAGLGAPRRRKQLIDSVVEEYVTWREECSRVARAYEGWLAAPLAERMLAHAGYAAALDREEQAAANYRRRLERLQPV
jgi:hypothetical protein